MSVVGCSRDAPTLDLTQTERTSSHMHTNVCSTRRAHSVKVSMQLAYSEPCWNSMTRELVIDSRELPASQLLDLLELEERFGLATLGVAALLLLRMSR